MLCVFTRTHKYEYMCIGRMHDCIHACTYMHTYTHTHTHAHIPTYLPTYIHTYIQTYIQTYTRCRRRPPHDCAHVLNLHLARGHLYGCSLLIETAAIEVLLCSLLIETAAIEMATGDCCSLNQRHTPNPEPSKPLASARVRQGRVVLFRSV